MENLRNDEIVTPVGIEVIELFSIDPPMSGNGDVNRGRPG